VNSTNEPTEVGILDVEDRQAVRRAYQHADAIGFIWSVANIIRDQGYHQHEYGDVILPFTVLRRLDQAAAPTRARAIETREKMRGRGFEDEQLDRAVARSLGTTLYSTSKIEFVDLIDDAEHLVANLTALVGGFPPVVREVFARFDFDRHVHKCAEKGTLYAIVSRFTEIDLDPARVSNLDMGYVFEELIRRFSELKNEEAGHHYTPREVIRLMVDLLLCYSDDVLTTPGKIVRMLDPACGTGGMLSVAEERIREFNADLDFHPFGQDFDDNSFAIAMSEQLMTARGEINIALGNSLTSKDAYKGQVFDFILANPPYGVTWKQYAKDIVAEHELGFDGRYGAGLPRKSDGQLLFVQHMISKMQPVTSDHPGGRVAIIMNGSPMFSGDAGSGESEIRRWIIENDMLEAVIGLPNDLFYNTGISTYIWILSNNKAPRRRGYVQLIDARDLYEKMPKSKGNKRVQLSDDHIDQIVSLYGDEVESDLSKWLPNADFGFQKVPIQRPRRARLQAGPEARQRLAEHPDWTESALRKGTENPDLILDTIAVEIERLDLDGLSVPDARKALAGLHGWSTLLKRGRGAVLDAVTVDAPDAPPLTDAKGRPEPDPSLRGFETVPLHGDIDTHLAAEVHPHASDAWAEHEKVKIGYEIPFTEAFYVYEPPPPLEEIDAELRKVEQEILNLLAEVTSH
jgi:type I restriction enzyme M protein